MPHRKLSDEEKREVLKNGLIHFTKESSADNILSNGFIGSISEMSLMEKKLGPLTWCYISDNDETITEKHKIVLRKKKGQDDSHNYNTCLIIKGLTEEDLSKMLIRKSDSAIVYKGVTFFPPLIEKIAL